MLVVEDPSWSAKGRGQRTAQARRQPVPLYRLPGVGSTGRALRPVADWVHELAGRVRLHPLVLTNLELQGMGQVSGPLVPFASVAFRRSPGLLGTTSPWLFKQPFPPLQRTPRSPPQSPFCSVFTALQRVSSSRSRRSGGQALAPA